MPVSELFISKETVERTSNCEFLLKIYHFPSFWKSVSSTKLTYTPTLSAIYALAISDRGYASLNADVSENTLQFVSQSINNLSDYDISQSVDWECPSLTPHVLLNISRQLVPLLEKLKAKAGESQNFPKDYATGVTVFRKSSVYVPYKYL